MLKVKQVAMCTYEDLFAAIAKLTDLDAWTIEEALGSNNSFVEDRAHDVCDAEGLIEGISSDVDGVIAEKIGAAVRVLMADMEEVHFV